MSFGAWRFESSQPHSESLSARRGGRAAALVLAAEGANPTDIGRRMGIPRPTVRDWLAGNVARRTLQLPPGSCSQCGFEHECVELPAVDVYLLGLYLGDGCLAAHPRGVFRLRIVLDAKYPRIIDECKAAIAEVGPRNRVGVVDYRTWVEVNAYSRRWPCLFPQHGLEGSTFARSPWSLGSGSSSPVRPA